MATMMAYPAPQQYMWNVQASVPHNWSGPWPPGAPAVYPGPPPVPHGVDPNAWKSGQWTFNPMFVSNPAVAAAGQAWAPHPVWGAAVRAAAQAQQAPDFNPYKRQPVPPSEEYKAQKLVANPLGLENMIPRAELEKDPSLTLPPTTPWLWTPKELNEEDSRVKPDATDTRDTRDRERRERISSSHMSSASASASASARQSQSQQSAPQPPQYSNNQQPLRRSSTMQSSQYPGDPNSQRSHERSAHNSRPPDPRTPPGSAPVTTSSFSSHYQQQQQQSSHSRSQSQHRSQSREPSSQPSSQYEPEQRQQQPYRQQTEPPVIPIQPPRTPVHVSSASAQARDSEQKRSEAFSSHETLRPTFSPSIVRTPGHYIGTPIASNSVNGTPSRRSTTDDIRDDRDPSRRLAREGSISRSSPARRDSTRRSGRDDPRSHYRDREYERPGGDDSDVDSPVRPHFHGPIYGPPTPTPGATSRTSTNNTSRSNTSPPITSRVPSLTTSMSTLSVDTAPDSASSSGSNGFLGLTGFSEEPEGMLSPLIVGGNMPSTKSSPRDLGRSQTYPNIPSQSGNGTPTSQENSPAPPLSRTSSKTPRASPSQPSAAHIRSPSSVGRSRTYPTLANDPLAGEPPVIPPKPSSISRPPSPHRLSARSPNPLPQPPMPISYSTSGSSASASASASAAASQQSYSRSRTQSQYSSPPSYNRHSPSAAPQPSPSRYSPHSSASASIPASSASASAAASRHGYSSSTSAPSYPQAYSQSRSTTQPQPRKVRHGFWNRRGDHLYFSSHSSRPFIVYAPRAVANPEELAQYPSATEGFRNHHGEFKRYDPSVPELPESLPAHGEPPLRPYESFVHYITM